MAHPLLADGEGHLQTWRVTPSILSKQSRIADRGWSRRRRTNNLRRKNPHPYTRPRTWTGQYVVRNVNCEAHRRTFLSILPSLPFWQVQTLSSAGCFKHLSSVFPELVLMKALMQTGYMQHKYLTLKNLLETFLTSRQPHSKRKNTLTTAPSGSVIFTQQVTVAVTLYTCTRWRPYASHPVSSRMRSSPPASIQTYIKIVPLKRLQPPGKNSLHIHHSLLYSTDIWTVFLGMCLKLRPRRSLLVFETCWLNVSGGTTSTVTGVVWICLPTTLPRQHRATHRNRCCNIKPTHPLISFDPL
jgi:hypothetical protein